MSSSGPTKMTVRMASVTQKSGPVPASHFFSLSAQKLTSEMSAEEDREHVAHGRGLDPCGTATGPRSVMTMIAVRVVSPGPPWVMR